MGHPGRHGPVPPHAVLSRDVPPRRKGAAMRERLETLESLADRFAAAHALWTELDEQEVHAPVVLAELRRLCAEVLARQHTTRGQPNRPFLLGRNGAGRPFTVLGTVQNRCPKRTPCPEHYFHDF